MLRTGLVLLLRGGLPWGWGWAFHGTQVGGPRRHSAEEAGGEGRTRGPKRKTDDLDIPRKRGKTGGTRRKPEDGNEADRENDLRGRGCGAGGRAEGGGGRGSEVPRRGFPK